MYYSEFIFDFDLEIIKYKSEKSDQLKLLIIQYTLLWLVNSII